MLSFRHDGIAATAELAVRARRASAGNASLVSATRVRIATCRRRLNPAWSFSGSSSDGRPRPWRRGLIVATLTAAHLDRIVLADSVLWLSDGATCEHRIGSRLEVIYFEMEDGRRFVERITALPPAR